MIMRITINMIVCLCEGVSDRAIQTTIEGGAKSVEAIGESCGAGTGCGSCHQALKHLLAKQGDKACGDRHATCSLAAAVATT